MEQRRFILFLVLSMGILLAWANWGMPLFFPPKPVAQQADKADGKKDGQPAPKDVANVAEEKRADDPVVAAKPGETGGPAAANPQAELKGAGPDETTPDALRPFPRKWILLGTQEADLEADSDYFLHAVVGSQGAALHSLDLNDPRYRDLDNPNLQLKLLGSSAIDPLSFNSDVDRIDEQLKKHNTRLSEVDWELMERVADPQNPKVYSAATFRYVSPDQKLEVRKRYALHKVDFKGTEPLTVRDSDPKGYEIDFSLTVMNLGDKPDTLTYTLVGPAGLPLENAANTSRFRSVQMAYYSPEEEDLPVEQRRIVAKAITAREIADDAVKNKDDVWQQPFKYVGVDIQYFTALMFPAGDQLKNNYIAAAKPIVIGQPSKDQTNIGVSLTSRPVALDPGKEAVHEYKLFAGPKRESLLAPMGAENALDFGWFGFVAKPMLWLLKFLHDNLGLPYGIAIIMLTVIVRACMYPISRKQAIGAQKMKELQPHIAELKKKYANDKEKMARAQMELFSKHNYNPFAGCLPIFLQFPIFIGLYQALNNAVDLRGARFLWIDNLAAPDALFHLPFTVPFVGWTEFNLLPLLTIVLFIVQQKMFMPPPAPDDEQAKLQQKMMMYMMVFMGFLFYKVPAGLCVYFIASSLWGMAERKLLDFQKNRVSSGPEVEEPEATLPKAVRKGKEEKRPEPTGLWARLLASAEASAQQSKTNGKSKGHDPKKKGKSRR